MNPISLKPNYAPQADTCYIGVGLRHQHFQEALAGSSSIDFAEVHAENFFADGGIASAFLDQFSDLYDISLHSTSMGLGSATGVNHNYLKRLNQLIKRTYPVLISDHASFAWSQNNNRDIHAGDLLPLEFSPASLEVLIENTDRAQQILGHQLLIENVSAYVDLDHSSLQETEFLVTAVERSNSKLLVDLNNLLVNERNAGSTDPLARAKQWLEAIPHHLVGEIHLAGYSVSSDFTIIIDDHSQAVSNECWELYCFALQRFGSIPTLIEWDNELPSWQRLVAEADKAREIFSQVFTQAGGRTHVG
ncbi:MAG: hypothetical protein CL693_07950 [Cellvibrionaceae bacterium]|nr:hypothetical protein [Cellvibrionaceae bacterium]